MTTCIYENCSKIGIYENFTLCTTHKGYNYNNVLTYTYTSEIPDKNAPPIPISVSYTHLTLPTKRIV